MGWGEMFSGKITGQGSWFGALRKQTAPCSLVWLYLLNQDLVCWLFFLKTYLTLPSVFHHNRNSLQMLRWLLGPQEGSVLKGTGWYQGQERIWHTFGFAVSPCSRWGWLQDGSSCAEWAQEQPLERWSEGPGWSDPGQDALTSPPPCADFSTANNSSDIWLATAAQGISFHTRHFFVSVKRQLVAQWLCLKRQERFEKDSLDF